MLISLKKNTFQLINLTFQKIFPLINIFNILVDEISFTYYPQFPHNQLLLNKKEVDNSIKKKKNLIAIIKKLTLICK